MQRRQRDYYCLFLLFVSLINSITTIAESATINIPIGVILDLDSPLGSIAHRYINNALEDFYDKHNSSTTKLQPLFKDSKNDILTAAKSAYDLIYVDNVSAILGPQNTELARYVVDLGDYFTVGVPVIWFPSSGPSLVKPRTRFFINSNFSRSHCYQFEAIAAIIENYNWQSVIPIYEEPEFGNDLIPCLTYALQDMNTRVPYISSIRSDSTKDNIAKELDKIIKEYKRTYVYLAHMTVELCSKLVKQAKDKGMMSEGHVWILTQGLSPFLDPRSKDTLVRGYMDGVLGVRPLLEVSLERTLMELNNNLSLYGLWAYDTVTTLANAVENSGLFDFNESRRVELRNENGPKLRKAIIQETNSEGMSGNFSLNQEQLVPSQFVVYNMKGLSENIIGYWRPEKGLFQNYSNGKDKLKEPTWPGNTTERPPKLKVGVATKAKFSEFVNVVTDMKQGQEKMSAAVGGFAVDVFKKVVDALPFPLPVDFVPLDNDNGYDDLLHSIHDKNVDVIIGDITILVNRTNYVDFTMPYLESRVSMVVNVRPDSKSGWILFKPFDLLLWLILGVVFLVATFIILIFERNKRDDSQSKYERLRSNPFLIYKSGVDSLRSDSSKSAVIMVMFVLGLAVQIYTANLTSILTDMTTAKSPPIKDVQEIKRNNMSVGYQKDSWVKDLLTKKIGLKDHQLKPLTSLEDYNEQLSKGAKKGGVDAIFDETPYLFLLLSICSSCKMTGPIYKTGGFAFAFQKNSTLISNFSAAILNVTENLTTFHAMKKNISLPYTIDKSEYKRVDMRSLTMDDFGVLFPVVCSVLTLFFIILICKLVILERLQHRKTTPPSATLTTSSSPSIPIIQLTSHSCG